MNFKIGSGTFFILILVLSPFLPAVLGFLAQTGILAVLLLIFCGVVIIVLWGLLCENLRRIDREQKFFAQFEQKRQNHQASKLKPL